MPQNDITFGQTLNKAYFALSGRGSSLLADSTTKNSFSGATHEQWKIRFRKAQTSISKLVDGQLSPAWIFMRFPQIFPCFSPR